MALLRTAKQSAHGTSPYSAVLHLVVNPRLERRCRYTDDDGVGVCVCVCVCLLTPHLSWTSFDISRVVGRHFNRAHTGGSQHRIFLFFFPLAMGVLSLFFFCEKNGSINNPSPSTNININISTLFQSNILCSSTTAVLVYYFQ